MPKTRNHNSNIYDAINYAIRTKRFVGGMVVLKRNGRPRKINGQIYARKINRLGQETVLIDNFFGKKRRGARKRWQTVMISNIRLFNENKWSHGKRIETNIVEGD